MAIVSKEAMFKEIEDLSGSGYIGNGSQENPLISIEGEENTNDLIIKVLLYATSFQSIIFFSCEGMIVEYNPESKELITDTDERNILAIAILALFKGREIKIRVVEKNPNIRIIKPDNNLLEIIDEWDK